MSPHIKRKWGSKVWELDARAVIGVFASRKFNPYVFIGDSRGADNR
jgi:hypothetical protein